jgi:hypothetical protein
MDTNRLVKTYVKMRDARNALKREYEEKDTALKEQMTKIENTMLKLLQDSNIDSIKTEAGTFYRQEEITPTGSDWQAFYDWVKANDAFDALERRIKKTFVAEFMETHDGAVPPGVSVYRQYVCRVRRN